MNGLANLQLLDGVKNVQKSDSLPMPWVKSVFPDEHGRKTWLAGHDMHDLPEGIEGFVDFYDARRKRMRKRIGEILIGKLTSEG